MSGLGAFTHLGLDHAAKGSWEALLLLHLTFSALPWGQLVSVCSSVNRVQCFLDFLSVPEALGASLLHIGSLAHSLRVGFHEAL